VSEFHHEEVKLSEARFCKKRERKGKEYLDLAVDSTPSTRQLNGTAI